MNYETNDYNNAYNHNSHNNDVGNEYNHDHDHNHNHNYNHNHNVEYNSNNNNTTEMNYMDSWRFKTLYTDTKYVFAAKTDEVLTCDKLIAQQNRLQEHPSSVPVILKDSTRPYTYYTMKSYGPAQDNNYYVNFDDHVNANANAAIPEYNHNNKTEICSKTSNDDSGCEKTYLCSLLGCFACSLFKICYSI